MERFELSYETIQFLIHAGILTGICFIAGVIINFVWYKFLEIYNKKRKALSISYFIRHTKKAAHLFTPFLLILVSSSLLKSYEYYSLFNKIVYVFFNISFAWMLIKMVNVLSDLILSKHDIREKDNFVHRKLITQMQFLKRIVIIVVIVIISSIILLNFEGIRKLGAGILTSAGVAGIIIGFAAQRSLSNLMAGLQIAFSQPIRIDDAVIVENEWGWVEEITLTYVVIKIWDLRRLVVPLNYFIEKPFQNWTRTSSQIMGTVELYVDYKMQVDTLREELTRILNESMLWDKQTNVLQVTGATENSILLRALMSAKDSGSAWDLRCLVREKLLFFIQKNFPDCLPRNRSEVILSENNTKQRTLN